MCVKILVRKHAPPPPRPVAWAKMATSLHRPDASEQLVQRSGQESKAVQQYSQALRAMSEARSHSVSARAPALSDSLPLCVQEIERHDGWGEVDPKSIADVSGGKRSPQRPVIENPDPDSRPRHEIDLLPCAHSLFAPVCPSSLCSCLSLYQPSTRGGSGAVPRALLCGLLL